MDISRRNFIAVAPLAAGVVLELNGLSLGQSVAKNAPRTLATHGTDSLSRLTWDSFVPYVTTDFTFSGRDGNRVTLKLTDMTDTKPLGFRGLKGQECFVLTFTGSGKALSQDTYAVEHFALGSFDLFVTALGSNRKSVVYKAVINRITE